MKFNKMYLVKTLESHYCKIVFAAVFALSYFLVPQKIFYRWYTLLGIAFMAMFALTITCIVRNIKERVMLKRTSGGSILSMIAVAVGFAALEVCGVGAPVCGATIGLGIFSTLLPGVTLGFFEKYGVYIVITTIALQMISLYFMNCFKEFESQSKISLEV